MLYAGDALELLSTTAELFLEAVAKKAYSEAVGAARGTLAFRDVGAISLAHLLRA